MTYMEDEYGFQYTAVDTLVLSVRMTHAEHKLLTEAARQRGVKLSTYMREVALHNAGLPLVSHSLEVERTTA